MSAVKTVGAKALSETFRQILIRDRRSHTNLSRLTLGRVTANSICKFRTRKGGLSLEAVDELAKVLNIRLVQDRNGEAASDE